jgi:hypothetical protein
MQLALAGIFVLALLALFVGPALAARSTTVVAPTIVAPAVDAFDKGIKLDSWVKGAIKIDYSGVNTLKWKYTSVKCDDVTVVATVANSVVSSTKGSSVPGDPASCVYSMKVPSGVALSIYAQLGSAESVGVTARDKSGLKSNVVVQKLAPPGAVKTAPQYLKIKDPASSSSLPLYLKLDT